jgi:uncharacterized membrane protein YeaQ/YmgE (transglycosylase-associated protein family)
VGIGSTTLATRRCTNEPSGFILTTILGIVGAIVATYLGEALGWYRPGEGAGLIGAVVGAIIALRLWYRRWQATGGSLVLSRSGKRARKLWLETARRQSGVEIVRRSLAFQVVGSLFESGPVRSRAMAISLSVPSSP